MQLNSLNYGLSVERDQGDKGKWESMGSLSSKMKLENINGFSPAKWQKINWIAVSYGITHKEKS